MKRILALFGIGLTRVYDIVYAWAHVLCTTLQKIFLVPTQSRMLQAYPKSVIKKFSHVNIFALLNVTKIRAQRESMKIVSAILYATYKHGSTIKCLAICCPIGSIANGM